MSVGRGVAVVDRRFGVGSASPFHASRLRCRLACFMAFVVACKVMTTIVSATHASNSDGSDRREGIFGGFHLVRARRRRGARTLLRVDDKHPNLRQHHQANTSSGDDEGADADEDEDGDGRIGERVAQNNHDDGAQDGVVDHKTNPTRLIELLGQVAYAEGIIGTHDEAETSEAEGDVRRDTIARLLLT